MSSLNLGLSEKDDVQAFIEALENARPNEFTGFTATFAEGNETAWGRFIKGAYNLRSHGRLAFFS